MGFMRGKEDRKKGRSVKGWRWDEYICSSTGSQSRAQLLLVLDFSLIIYLTFHSVMGIVKTSPLWTMTCHSPCPIIHCHVTPPQSSQWRQRVTVAFPRARVSNCCSNLGNPKYLWPPNSVVCRMHCALNKSYIVWPNSIPILASFNVYVSISASSDGFIKLPICHTCQHTSTCVSRFGRITLRDGCLLPPSAFSSWCCIIPSFSPFSHFQSPSLSDLSLVALTQMSKLLLLHFSLNLWNWFPRRDSELRFCRIFPGRESQR